MAVYPPQNFQQYRIRLMSDSAANPPLSFLNDPATGIYNPSAGVLSFVTGGVARAQIDTGLTLLPDVNLYRSAANVLKTDDNFDALALRIGGIEVITSGRALQNIASVNTTLNMGSGQKIIFPDENLEYKLQFANLCGISVRPNQEVDWLLNASFGGHWVIKKTDGVTETTLLDLDKAGNLSITSLTLGGDTNLYRWGANILQTDSELRVRNGLLAVAGNRKYWAGFGVALTPSIFLQAEVADSVNTIRNPPYITMQGQYWSGTSSVDVNFGIAPYILDTAGNARLDINVAGATPLSLLSNGNVGIGTPSPAYNLDVRSSGRPWINIESTGANQISSIRLKTSAAEWHINNEATSYGGAFDIWSSVAGHTLVINPTNGNVGIGTTNPSSFKLQVAGSAGPDADNAYDLGSSTLRWRNVYCTNLVAGDIQFKNDWKITEDPKHGLVLVSPGGKRYRFKLEEVSDEPA